MLRINGGRFLFVLVLCFISLASHADSWLCPQDLSRVDASERIRWTNIGGAAVVTAWGIAKWDYGTRRPHAHTEGWLSTDTQHGGADKVGHIYTTYLATRALSELHNCWGRTAPDDIAFAAWSAFGLMGVMEFGDSFSDFGFSYEDFVMNGLGAYAGYLLASDPQLASKVDLRVEYALDVPLFDFATEYDQMKFLLAVKFAGFAVGRSAPWRYLELHLGYFARGYGDSSGVEPRRRETYAAIGVNLAELIRRSPAHAAAPIFNYLQIPHTYFASED